MTADKRAIVIGGGIAGLTTAFDLHRAGWAVTVHEAADHWGGKIITRPVGDRPVDAGPDAFLARVDHGYDLCRDLGLADELTSPVSPVPAYVRADGVLHSLPTGTMFGVPTDLSVLEDSALISPAGIARAAADLTMAPSSLDPDPSVGEVCRERLGDEVTDRLIDPLIGAINASDIDRLSLGAAAPQLAAALRDDGSLIRGMAAARERAGATLGSGSDKPVFYGLPGGIARIIERLVEALAGADLRLESEVSSIDEITSDGVDAVVLAVPAHVAAKLLVGDGHQVEAGDGPRAEAAELLAGIEYADVAQVVAELPIAGLDRVLDASGVLFPRVDGMLMTACTWLSTKWAHYRRDDTVLVRMSAGRFGDHRHAALADDELTAALLDELGTVVELSAEPVATRIVRWQGAFPQYTPGHAGRVARLRAALAEADPTLAVVGAPYDGIGVPACIAAARAAAAAALTRC